MVNDKKSLCLVYAHPVRKSKWSHSVYKIDLPDVDENTAAATLNKDGRFDQIDPVMVLPNDTHIPLLMRCARIGTKLYVLGGEMPNSLFLTDLFPRKVYAFDLLSKPTTQSLDVAKEDKDREEEVDVFMKMHENIVMNMDVAYVTTVPVLKPFPLAFSANGLLYVFGSTTRYFLEEYDEQGLKNLFQCFDPVRKMWTTLKHPPPVNKHKRPTTWVGVNVFHKRQQVVLLGDEETSHSAPLKVLFFYDLKTNEWTRCDLTLFPFDGLASLTFLDVDTDKDYLYGLSLRGILVKSKTDHLSIEDDFGLASNDGSVPIGNDNRLLKMIIPNEPDDVFGLRYFRTETDCYFQSQFLRYLGKGLFCVISCSK